jgi:hypothetical protein
VAGGAPQNDGSRQVFPSTILSRLVFPDIGLESRLAG